MFLCVCVVCVCFVWRFSASIVGCNMEFVIAGIYPDIQGKQARFIIEIGLSFCNWRYADSCKFGFISIPKDVLEILDSWIMHESNLFSSLLTFPY